MPTALFSYVAIFGTVAAPIYAGFVDESLGPWWQEWIQMIQNGVLLVVVALTLKETRGDVKLKKRAKQIRKVTGDDRYIAEIELEARNFADLLVQSRSVLLTHSQLDARLLMFDIFIFQCQGYPLADHRACAVCFWSLVSSIIRADQLSPD